MEDIYRQQQRENIEEICRKLRLCVKEHGRKSLNGAVIIGPDDLAPHVGGVKYIEAPTLGQFTLGNVDWKVARFFEDC